MISQLVSRVISLGLGTLYPAYRSYKAVRTKDVREYVKWMMYWVIFALFTTAETFTDVFLGFWFPFYFELKIATLIAILPTFTNGSSVLFRKFVHPYLKKNEHKIDQVIERTKWQSYNTVLAMGRKAVAYAKNMVVEYVVRAPNVMVEILSNDHQGLVHHGRPIEDRSETDGAVNDDVANVPRVDIDMSDEEERDGGDTFVHVDVGNAVIEEAEEEGPVDPFDLGDNEALDFSSGDEDPDFSLPEGKKKGRSKQDVGDIDMAKEVQDNTVGKLTVDVLKAWLKPRGVSTSKMKKADLVEAVREIISKED